MVIGKILDLEKVPCKRWRKSLQNAVGNLRLKFEGLAVALGSLPITVVRRYDKLHRLS